MKKLGFVAFGLLAVCAFSVPAIAQKKQWTYKADNGRDGDEREEMTITITQKPNGYVVSGEYARHGSIVDGPATCPIRGTYYPKTERIHAKAVCTIYEFSIDGHKVGADRFQITKPWTANAWLEGIKRKQPGTGSGSTGSARFEIPQRMDETEGPFTATWTLLSGNQFEAKWSNGAHAILTIAKFDSEGVLIMRGDTAASVSQGFSAVYTGTISGNSVSGKVKFMQNGQTWEGTWSASW